MTTLRDFFSIPPWVRSTGKWCLWIYMGLGFLLVVMRWAFYFAGVEFNPVNYDDDTRNLTAWFWVCVCYGVYRLVKWSRARSRARFVDQVRQQVLSELKPDPPTSEWGG